MPAAYGAACTSTEDIITSKYNSCVSEAISLDLKNVARGLLLFPCQPRGWAAEAVALALNRSLHRFGLLRVSALKTKVKMQRIMSNCSIYDGNGKWMRPHLRFLPKFLKPGPESPDFGNICMLSR